VATTTTRGKNERGQGYKKTVIIRSCEKGGSSSRRQVEGRQKYWYERKREKITTTEERGKRGGVHIREGLIGERRPVYPGSRRFGGGGGGSGGGGLWSGWGLGGGGVWGCAKFFRTGGGGGGFCWKVGGSFGENALLSDLHPWRNTSCGHAPLTARKEVDITKGNPSWAGGEALLHSVIKGEKTTSPGREVKGRWNSIFGEGSAETA